MDHCNDCAIDDKVYCCCGRYPDTGVSVEIILEGGRKIYACPYLSDAGKCVIYARRPLRCREYYCSQYDQLMTEISDEYLELLTTWDINTSD